MPEFLESLTDFFEVLSEMVNCQYAHLRRQLAVNGWFMVAFERSKDFIIDIDLSSLSCSVKISFLTYFLLGVCIIYGLRILSGDV